MQNARICTLVRKRTEWPGLVPLLLRDGGGKWNEVKFATHDIEITLSGAGQAAPNVFRALLLAPAQVGTAGTRERLQRLCILDGGRNVAVIFLMKRAEQGSENAVAAMMRLQLDLLGGLEMPIIPVPSADAVPAAVASFCRHLATRVGSSTASLRSPHELLASCTDTSQPLSEHTTNILSDITSSMRDMVDKVATEEGQQLFVEYLGYEAARVIRFWQEERSVD